MPIAVLIACEYVCPTVPAGSVLVVTVSILGAIAIEIDVVAVAAVGIALSVIFTLSVLVPVAVGSPPCRPRCPP